MLQQLRYRSLLVLIIMLGAECCYGERCSDTSSGNIQFPSYAPLWAIGHRNIRKNQVLVANRFVDTHEENASYDVSIMSVRYGFTDQLTAFAYLPVVYNNREDVRVDSGLGNFALNAEYKFFEKFAGEHRSRATMLFEVGFPTATTVPSRLPLLDTESYRFLVGTTGDYGTMSAYFYYSLGLAFYTKHQQRRPGNEFIYEWGFTPVLYHSKDHDLFLFVDWNGRYAGHDTVHDVRDPATGGNILLMGSALEYRYKNLLAYISFQAPITQSFRDIVHFRTSFYVNVVF
jgi:hypothetical protein